MPGVAALAPALFFAGVERCLSNDSRPLCSIFSAARLQNAVTERIFFWRWRLLAGTSPGEEQFSLHILKRTYNYLSHGQTKLPQRTIMSVPWTATAARNFGPKLSCHIDQFLGS